MVCAGQSRDRATACLMPKSDFPKTGHGLTTSLSLDGKLRCCRGGGERVKAFLIFIF